MSRKPWAVGMMIPFAAASAIISAPAATAVAPARPVALDVAAVQNLGPCKGLDINPSDVDLKARATLPGRIELTFRLVNRDRVGQGWRVRIFRNGGPIVDETVFTTFHRNRFLPFLAGSSVFTFRKVVNNMPGVDRFVATATNPRTRETCTASAWVRP